MRVRTQRVPVGYRELEYIESTDYQYIDTGIYPNQNIGVDVDFKPIVRGTIFGVALNNGCYYGINLHRNLVFEVYWGNSGTKALMSNTPYALDTQIYNLRFNVNNSKKVYVDSTQVCDLTTFSSNPSSNSYSIYLFRLNGDYTQYISSKLYKCKMYDNTTIVRNFIPVERQSDSKPGLYDTVNNVFYTNSGTGEFVKGPYKDSYNCPVIIQEGTTNLFGGRADFSDGTKWVLKQINSTLPTLDADGNMTLYGYSTSGNTQSYATSNQGGYIPIQSSTTYTLSMLVKYSSTTAYFNYYFYEKNSSGTTIKSNSWRVGCTASELGHWVLRSKTITTQSNTVSMYAELNCYQNPATDYIIVKNKSIQLEQKDHATPFVDGTRPDNYIAIGSPKINLLPVEYQGVEYIESSGTQYIDTGVKPHSITPIVHLHFKTKVVVGGGNGSGLFGSYETNARFQVYNSSVGIGNAVYYTFQDFTNYKIVLDGANLTAKINDTNITSGFTNGYTTNSYNMYLFTRNQYNVADAQTPMKLYSCQIYDNSTLVRNFLPCYRKSDSVIGLYDTVNKQFYTNSGTGTFTKGPDKNYII